MYSNYDIIDLVRQFENRTLPKELWTHEAHLAVALQYCLSYGPEDVLNKLRENICGYNEAVGTPNTKTNGYHETITRFWLREIRAFVNDNQPETDPAELCTRLLSSEVADKKYLLNFYSRELLFSPQARLGWAEPDLVPYPQDFHGNN